MQCQAKSSLLPNSVNNIILGHSYIHVFYVLSMMQWQSSVTAMCIIIMPLQSLKKTMVWSFTESFTDPVSEYLGSCPFTFHFFPQMVAGPSNNPIHPSKCCSAQAPHTVNILLTSSIEHHHARDHEHRVPVEHVHTAIPGKAATPILHPIGGEEDAQGSQGPQDHAEQVKPS